MICFSSVYGLRLSQWRPLRYLLGCGSNDIFKDLGINQVRADLALSSTEDAGLVCAPAQMARSQRVGQHVLAGAQSLQLGEHVLGELLELPSPSRVSYRFYNLRFLHRYLGL